MVEHTVDGLRWIKFEEDVTEVTGRTELLHKVPEVAKGVESLLTLGTEPFLEGLRLNISKVNWLP